MRPRLSPWLALPAALALLVAAVAQQAPLGSVPIVVSLTNLLARLPSSNAPAALVLGATNAYDWGAPRLIVWDAASSATANGSNTWATASGVGRWRWWEVAGQVDLSGYARLDATNNWSALQLFSELEFETLLLPGPWAVGVGGTGGTNAAQARANLGADHAANLTQGTLDAARLPATVTLDAEAAAAYQAKSTVLDQFAGLVGQSGDVAYHDGNGWVRRPLGTNSGGIVYDVEVGPFLTTNATAVALLTNTIPADTTRSLRLEVLGAGSPTSGVSVARSLVALARQSGGALTLSTNPAPAAASQITPLVIGRLAGLTQLVSSTTETALFSFTVSSNALSTNKAVRIRLIGSALNNTGGTESLETKVVFGGTTLYEDAGSHGTSTSSKPLYYDLVLAAHGAATNVVLGGLLMVGTSGGAIAGLGDANTDETTTTAPIFGNASIDTTTNNLLEVRFQNSSNSVNQSVSIYYGEAILQ